MTEKFEIEDLIDDIREVQKELEYEANTDPGNGQEFVWHLRGAIRFLEIAVHRLEDAKSTFDIEEG